MTAITGLTGDMEGFSVSKSGSFRVAFFTELPIAIVRSYYRSTQRLSLYTRNRIYFPHIYHLISTLPDFVCHFNSCLASLVKPFYSFLYLSFFYTTLYSLLLFVPSSRLNSSMLTPHTLEEHFGDRPSL